VLSLSFTIEICILVADTVYQRFNTPIIFLLLDDEEAKALFSLHFFWHGKPVSITHTLQADRRRPDGLQMWGQAHDTHSRKSKQHSAPYLARQTATVTWSRTTLNFTTNKRRVNYLEFLQLFWCVGLWDEYDDRVIPTRWHTGMVPPFSTSSTYPFTFSQQELRSSCKILLHSIFVIVVDILSYILSGSYLLGTVSH
jgi:hypothetical protein